MTITILIKLPDDTNKRVEIFKALNELQSKENAIIKMLDSVKIDYSSELKFISEQIVFEKGSEVVTIKGLSVPICVEKSIDYLRDISNQLEIMLIKDKECTWR